VAREHVRVFEHWWRRCQEENSRWWLNHRVLLIDERAQCLEGVSSPLWRELPNELDFVQCDEEAWPAGEPHKNRHEPDQLLRGSHAQWLEEKILRTVPDVPRWNGQLV